MRIFIMRHGEAGHVAFSDAERLLTSRGKSDSVAVIKQAIVQHGPFNVDHALVSPYVRAQETWDEIASYVKAKEVEPCDDITPYGQSEPVYDYVVALSQSHNTQSLFIVSHLPLVGYLTSEFAKGETPPMFPTSGLVCLDFDPQSGKGDVLWKVTP